MKKLSILFISSLIGTAGVITSCSDDDYPGPDPVDVTSNYSNKYASHSNLTLTYDGTEVIGKSVDFSTVKGKTANITFYNVLPGEDVLKLSNIPITGDAEGYSFSGNRTGDANSNTFNYAGRVEKGKLTIDLKNINMAQSSQWAGTYALDKITYGRNKSMIRNSDTGLYEWGEADNKMVNAPIYVDMDIELSSSGSFLYASVTGLIRGIASYMVGQLLKDVTFEPNGYITANYTSDEMMLGDQKFSEIDMDDPVSMGKVSQFITYKIFIGYPMGGFQQQDIIDATEGVNRQYIPSPKGLAYWYMRDGMFYLKLDLPAVITEVMKNQGKTVDYNLISTLTEVLLGSDPIQLKEILGTLNAQLDNSLLSMITSLDDDQFRMIFSWMKEGIPMHLEEKDGKTCVYLTKEALDPFIPFLPALGPMMEGIPNFGPMLFDQYIMAIYNGWSTISKLNIGLELTSNN